MLKIKVMKRRAQQNKGGNEKMKDSEGKRN